MSNTHPTRPPEWQRLAWAIAAHDAGTDIPTYRDDDQDEEAAAFRSWAESAHGAAAREFIAAFDALTKMREVAR